MIDWLTGPRRRLDEEHVLLADVVQDAHEDVLVRELEHLGLAGLAVQPVGDLPRQLGVGVAVVDLELVRVHACLPFAEGGHDERPCPSSVRSATVRLGVVIVTHGTPLRQPGAERGDRDDLVPLGEPHDDHAARARASSG